MEFEIFVLDWGGVTLDGCLADDLSVINSARVSFQVRHDQIEEGDDKLIAYLMKNRHGTPFEHNMFRFHVKAPIFVFREWQRHRIGSFNELSARYKELPAEWYVPREEDVRVRVGKPGHYTYEPADKYVAETFTRNLREQCQGSYNEYQHHLSEGIAPELARCFLHVNHFSEMYWTVNARSLMNFLSLRTHETAQFEIRQYANCIERIFRGAMPLTHKAWIDNGKVAP